MLTEPRRRQTETDMISALAMLACPNLAVPPQLMYHVAMVESRASPFAIGVVGGRLARQPRDLAEAVATARMLDAAGYNFSVGIAQVNRANLARYGLDTWEKAFDVCPNLLAGSRILAACHDGAGGAWDKAFSCYYSGDHVTGIRDGYVQKIFASLGAARIPGTIPAGSIPLLPAARPRNLRTATGASMAPGGGAHRVAIRSATIDPPMNTSAKPADAPAPALPVPTLAMTDPSPMSAAGALPGAAAQPAAPVSGAPAPAVAGVARPDGAPFVPQVGVPAEIRVADAQTSASATSSAIAGDAMDLPPDGEDSAFVF